MSTRILSVELSCNKIKLKAGELRHHYGIVVSVDINAFVPVSSADWFDLILNRDMYILIYSRSLLTFLAAMIRLNNFYRINM